MNAVLPPTIIMRKHNMLINRAYLVFGAWVLILLFIISCGENTPLSPYESATTFEYFPLHYGYNPKYSFSYTKGSDDGYHSRNAVIEGVCEIKVSQFINKTPYSFSTVQVSYSVSRNINEYWDSIEDQDIKEERYNYTEQNSYDLIQSADSVWYVAGAPDFMHMDQGARSLMLHSPTPDQNNYDLHLFTSLIGINSFSGKSSFKGDTLVVTDLNPDFYDPSNPCGWTVKMLRDKGVILIERSCWSNAGGLLRSELLRFKLME